MCGPRKHNCQPFCGPEGRFDCSDSVCSSRPAPLYYLCVRVRILGVMKIICCCTIKPDCRVRLLWSPFFDRLRCLCPVLLPLHSITCVKVCVNVLSTAPHSTHVHLTLDGKDKVKGCCFCDLLFWGRNSVSDQRCARAV